MTHSKGRMASRAIQVNAMTILWEGRRGNGLLEIFFALSLSSFSRKVHNFEFRINGLLQVIAVDCYCTFAFMKSPSNFLCVFDFACKQQLIGNFQVLIYVLCLYYFLLCHRPVILFLSH